MILEWSPIEGVYMATGSRAGSIRTAWRGVPEAEQTPTRRRLTIALVDYVREYHATTGKYAPEAAS